MGLLPAHVASCRPTSVRRAARGKWPTCRLGHKLCPPQSMPPAYTQCGGPCRVHADLAISPAPPHPLAATVGFGDVHAVNTLERIMAIIVILIGLTVFASFVTSVSRLLGDIDGRKSRRRMQARAEPALGRSGGLQALRGDERATALRPSPRQRHGGCALLLVAHWHGSTRSRLAARSNWTCFCCAGACHAGSSSTSSTTHASRRHASSAATSSRSWRVRGAWGAEGGGHNSYSTAVSWPAAARGVTQLRIFCSARQGSGCALTKRAFPAPALF